MVFDRTESLKTLHVTVTTAKMSSSTKLMMNTTFHELSLLIWNLESSQIFATQSTKTFSTLRTSTYLSTAAVLETIGHLALSRVVKLAKRFLI